MTRARRATAVIDLGFGDAGKGLLVDYLVRSRRAHTVIRFGGGAQAGHNVVTSDGRHHTFSQFGSGSFIAGVRTFLSHGCVVHPTAILVEAQHLAAVDVPDALDRLHVSPLALVATPFHQAAGRLREIARGRGRHGSCGVGVGEAVADHRAGRTSVVMGDILDSESLTRKVAAIQERKRAEMSEVIRATRNAPVAIAEHHVLEDVAVPRAWVSAASAVARCVADDDMLDRILAAPGEVVLEGAHSVLIDEWRGFHPYTTYTTCTAEPARTLLRHHDYDGPIAVLGATRTYQTRHGPGPLPTETTELGRMLLERHNAPGPWQGPMRHGWPDWVLLRYALAVSGGVDGLAVTHMDALDRMPSWKAAIAYRGEPFLVPGHREDLDHQAALAARLAEAVPVYEDLGPKPVFLDRIEAATGKTPCLASYGPTAADVRRDLTQ